MKLHGVGRLNLEFSTGGSLRTGNSVTWKLSGTLRKKPNMDHLLQIQQNLCEDVIK